MSIIIMKILPAEETYWGRKSTIEQVNAHLKESCSSSYGFLFIEQAGCWTDSSGKIDRNLFWRDNLHLNKSGCKKLAKIYADAIIKAKNVHHKMQSKFTPSANAKEAPTTLLTGEVYKHIPPQDFIHDKPDIKYHRCHNRPRKQKKPKRNKEFNSPPYKHPVKTPPQCNASESDSYINNGTRNVHVNFQFNFFSKVFMLFLLFSCLLMFCGFSGESLEGDDVCDVINFIFNVVRSFGMIFFHYFEGVSFLSGTSGVKWE